MVEFTNEQRKSECHEETTQSIMNLVSLSGLGGRYFAADVNCPKFIFACSNSAHNSLSSIAFFQSIYMNDAQYSYKLAPEITLRELPASNIRRISDCPD